LRLGEAQTLRGSGNTPMADPYEVLGVRRYATQAEIRKAYLRLAKSSHPDLHPGDKTAEARFKDIAAANDIVGDEQKRARFDAGEIDASGAERPQRPPRPSYREHAEAAPGFKYGQYNGGAGDIPDDLFASIFGARAERGPARGSDIGYTLAVDFLEAINGAKKRVVMADGKALDITIPAGLNEGQTLRLRGKGQPGAAGGPPGDAMVEMHVKAHPFFRRDGDDICSILAVTPGEAMAGAKVSVETASGRVTLTVPKGSNSGVGLRLRGKGVPATRGKGDHLVELQVVLPEHPDEDFVRAVTDWETKHPYDPRKRQEART
jgi:DnaJ-class molecular chaperone